MKGRISMSKVIIISNRLPVSVEMSEQSINYKMSIGGLATGLKSYHNKSDSIWEAGRVSQVTV